MNGTNRIHPLIMVAAAAVILTCLVALGVMTGIIGNKTTTPAQELTVAPDAPKALQGGTQFAPGQTASTTVTQEKRTVTRAPAPAPERRAAAREAAPAGATSSSASQSVAGSGPAAPAACMNCGTVTSVRAVKSQGEAGLIGPAAGALLGGVLGNQIGGGTGKTIATVVGAGVGAAGGTEAERRYKSTTSYVVAVRLNDGTTREFTYENDPGVQAGSKVRVVDGRLLHG
jgi:outer membrane lipoprotein SlyB